MRLRVDLSPARSLRVGPSNVLSVIGLFLFIPSLFISNAAVLGQASPAASHPVTRTSDATTGWRDRQSRSKTYEVRSVKSGPDLRNRDSAVESKNFVVYSEDPVLSRKVSSEAERYRKLLASRWLGHELPAWDQKCPIQVKVSLHAGGETSFAFVTDRSGQSRPIDWRMKIFGPVDRLLDSVLPHEITHTLFATHFGCPLPRWADEGACTTVEHASERSKNHQMLMDFLSASPSRGIPFNRMFTLKNYPHDILPLYAQGYSLAKFLIQKKGHRHFLDYIEEGIGNERQMPILIAWDRATKSFYGYTDLSELQIDWLVWVKQGSPQKEPIASQGNQPPKVSPEALVVTESPPALAATKTRAEDKVASLLTLGGRDPVRGSYVSRASHVEDASPSTRPGNEAGEGSWYRREMNRPKAVAREAVAQESSSQSRIYANQLLSPPKGRLLRR